MSNLEISIPSGMSIDCPSLLSASTGMPLTTIQELSSEDEYEQDDYEDRINDECVCALFTDDIFITTTIQEEEEENCQDTTMMSGRSFDLSINMSFLSPSSPTLSSAMSWSSPPSASYSSCSSAVSSPRSECSPILNAFQWTSDIRQYIMTDIGPQPSNSQVPAMRSHLYLVRQRSYSKIGGLGYPGWNGCDESIKGQGATFPAPAHVAE